MKIQNLIRIILVLSMIALVAGSGCAQRAVKSTGGETGTPEGPKITIKGKIGFMSNLGGYYVLGLEPGGEMIIVNKNPQVLEDLSKSGKIVMIEGRIVRGAEYLFIEKIDGQPYAGKEPSASK